MRKWDEPLISWSRFLILSFDRKEEVTQTKRERERRIPFIVIISKREFLEWREEKRENWFGREKTNPSSELEEDFVGHVSQDKDKSEGINC